jgi:hypothetical protein
VGFTTKSQTAVFFLFSFPITTKKSEQSPWRIPGFTTTTCKNQIYAKDIQKIGLYYKKKTGEIKFSKNYLYFLVFPNVIQYES